ncbi:sporulation protein YqfD [Desulfuribacillus alkaliarsenatis]|uniref:Sporulation protein YqfD n=1 Tax=Desulfuribacillus alkaliarsenatis TaxID=766136 RepID=A0A1E5G081_9FIRM|nr:sporulation protein YqfD [Desulfuribacillus alkaliarsenatis]OEF96224.1 sporulation protein YqfD [Desulfuribacillus alkaliarsenatis]
MISSWLKNMFLGAISVQISGKLLSTLLNQLNRAGISLWNVTKTSEESITFTMSIKDFKEFTNLVKKTGCKFTIKRKYGLPFLNWRLQKRYMFLAGFLFFLLFIWTMSQFIWDIEITGHDGKYLAYEHERTIRSELQELGIKEGSWKRKMPEKDIIQNQLREQLQNDYIWIGMEIKGTQLLIIAVPLTKPKEDEEILIESDLVATKRAIIHRILAYDGIAYVKEGQRVEPGQILISGFFSKEKKIPAKGVVEGIVWYTVEVELPLERTVETYTGEAINKYNFVLRDWSLPLYLPNRLQELENHDKRTSIKKLSWRSLSFPVELHVDTYYETKTETIFLNEDAAKDQAVEMAFDKISKQVDFIEVVSQTIMHYNIDDGKIEVKLLAEVIEDITMRKLIDEKDYIDDEDNDE